MDEENDSPTSCRHCSQLQCAVTVESVATSNGAGGKKTTHRTALVTVGRNEYRDIFIRLDLGGSSLTYELKDVRVHYKFARDGRGSIELPSKRIVVQLSNCPPHKLNVLLRSLDAKLMLMKKGLDVKSTPVSVRERLLGGLPRAFEKLSPLTLNEMKQLQNCTRQFADNTNVSTNPPAKCSPGRTPKSKRSSGMMKRSLKDENSSENNMPEVSQNMPTDGDRLQLSAEQKTVVKAVLSGVNVFFTGSAGTGKSLVLRRIVGFLPASTTFITAATGVAACQIGGVTVHSFAGIGSGQFDLERSFELASRRHIAQQWRKCTHLIIDEISMIDADFFTKMEHVARYVRGNDRPFGGIQLILCGDFFQLPPVTPFGVERKFCFESAAWLSCVARTIVLKEVRRQSDSQYVSVLQQIRFGRCGAAAANLLNETRNNCLEKAGVLPTRLCTHTNDADAVNRSSLDKLKGEQKLFSAIDSESIPDSVQSNAPKDLKLIVGAQVMLTKNLDLSRNLSNGARGVVKSFRNGYPVVQFAVGFEELIRPAKFTIRLPGNQAWITRVQIPLRLAWAISIHKSQGMTLDCVEMSLSRVFEDGQAYVALSRAKSLQSIRVLDFDPNCIRANERVVRFYEQISREESSDDVPVYKRQRLGQFR
uniref:ATP-dependent DNA helicase PIF1 n=1 Tax=Plectus sambesii TaxID=2011161 RepID=A0A914VT25_9BILA